MMFDDRCIVCGVIIPEGRQVCPNCESKLKTMPESFVQRMTAALRNATPCEPIGDLHSVPHFRCPSCEKAVKTYCDSPQMPFCSWCGQALKWHD